MPVATVTATVGRERTVIPHGQSFTPVIVVPVAPPWGVVVWSDAPPDATNIYMRASVSVSVTMMLRFADAVDGAGVAGRLAYWSDSDTLSSGELLFLTFRGRLAAGAIALTGAAVGDVVRFIQGMVLAFEGSGAAQFEPVITVPNQIQQSGAGLLALNYLAVLERRP